MRTAATEPAASSVPAAELDELEVVPDELWDGEPGR
jgi:hypothetical protein